MFVIGRGEGQVSYAINGLIKLEEYAKYNLICYMIRTVEKKDEILVEFKGKLFYKFYFLIVLCQFQLGSNYIDFLIARKEYKNDETKKAIYELIVMICDLMEKMNKHVMFVL
jgi:hypothetical protein